MHILDYIILQRNHFCSFSKKKKKNFVVFLVSLLGPLFLDNIHILDYIILQINFY